MKLSAIALSALIATAGIAQAQSMGEGFDMLQNALQNDFEVLGIEMDSVEGLTLAQLAQIRSVLEDNELSTSAKRNRIETITGQ